MDLTGTVEVDLSEDLQLSCEPHVDLTDSQESCHKQPSISSDLSLKDLDSQSVKNLTEPTALPPPPIQPRQSPVEISDPAMSPNPAKCFDLSTAQTSISTLASQDVTHSHSVSSPTPEFDQSSISDQWDGLHFL